MAPDSIDSLSESYYYTALAKPLDCVQPAAAFICQPAGRELDARLLKNVPSNSLHTHFSGILPCSRFVTLLPRYPLRPLHLGVSITLLKPISPTAGCGNKAAAGCTQSKGCGGRPLGAWCYAASRHFRHHRISAAMTWESWSTRRLWASARFSNPSPISGSVRVDVLLATRRADGSA